MSVFRFKQFDVDQQGCAMKINTDGVLLAAMVNYSKPNRILDIGTGTGVIALMLAQRFPLAQIDAIDIEYTASQRASQNFLSSPFSERLQAFHESMENWSPSFHYDLVVSNPPFFINDLKNSEKNKGIARHADPHFFQNLIQKLEHWLSAYGECWLILPVKQALEVIKLGEKASLHLAGITNIYSDQNKEVIRMVIALSKDEKLMRQSDFYIYESEKVHTQEYQNLLKDFFLAY